MAKKILIIEDEQTLIKALLDSFGGNGYEVETALDGEEGWKKMKANRPDLILLDLILPKMDGFELLNKIKKDDEVKNVPVVILTNLSDVTNRCEELGAKHCFVKSDESIDNIKKAVKDALS
jgi:DNA-binding response OmpR family regulator